MVAKVQNPLMMLVDAAASQSSPRPSTPPATVVSPTPESPPGLAPASDSESESSGKSTKTKMSFADAMMDMLMDEQYSRIVTFLPDGHSWGITDAKQFADSVMPKVFGIRTFSSFVRKLNRWGFERIMEKKTHDIDVFRHANFRKGDWESCRKIKCIGRLAKNPSEMTSAGPETDARIVTPPLAGLKRSLSAASYSPALATAAAPPQLFPAVSTGRIGPTLDQIRRDDIELQYLAQRRAEILARKYGFQNSAPQGPRMGVQMIYY